jgi:hypothetical protein
MRRTSVLKTLLAGASSGYLRASVGDTKASGAHAEPAVRMTFRLRSESSRTG